MKPEFHENEVVVLRASQPLDRVRLDRCLLERGYKSEDEFYYLERKDSSERWQTQTVLTLDVKLYGLEIYETDDDVRAGSATLWDELDLSYLLATLPRECITTFVSETNWLASEFGLSIGFQGQNVETSTLFGRLNAIANQLLEEWDAPGSEALAILIHQSYRRR